MLIRFIPVSIILSISYASIFDNLINDDNVNLIYPQNENPAYYDLNEKLLLNMRVLNQKLDDLEKKIPDKIENNINGKLQSLEQYMSQKLNALEERISNKIAVVNQKLDKLSIKEHNFVKNNGFNVNKATCEMNEQKLDNIVTKLSQLENNTYSQFEELVEKIMELKRSLIGSWIVPENIMSSTEINIEPKLDSLEQIATKSLVKNFNSPLDAVIKNIFENNSDYDILKNTPAKNSKELDEENPMINHNLLNKPRILWECKTRVVRGYDFKPIRLDSETPFNYATIETDSAGLKYFEINFAIKSDGMVMIPLSSVPNPGRSDKYFAIGVGDGHAYTWIRMVHPYSDNDDSVYLEELLDSASTHNILSPTTFKEFYIKISNYTLEFGERGTEAPILNHTDDRFSTIKYIGFTSWGDYYDAEYLYDCPIDFKETTTINGDTKEESFNSIPFESVNLMAGTEVNTEEDLYNSTPSGLDNIFGEEYFDSIPFDIENVLSGTELNMEEDLSNSTPSVLEITTPSSEENLKNLLDSHKEKLIENLENDELLKTGGVRDCKTRVVRGYDFKPIRLDSETPLNYAIIETDSAGLKHFDIDVAIKSDGMVMIPLSSEASPTAASNYFAIGVGDGHAYSWIRTLRRRSKNDDSVYLSSLLQQAATRNIVSPAVFKLFYVKIYNNTLEFGERDTEAPILNHTDDRFSTIKYIGFTSWGDYYDAEYLYDCPNMAAYFEE